MSGRQRLKAPHRRGSRSRRSRSRHTRRRARRAESAHGIAASPQAAPAPLPRASAPVPDRRSPVAALTSALLGITTAMVISGLQTHFQVVFRGVTVSGTLVVSIALLTVALGVRIPQRFARWVCSLAWRRFVVRGRPSEMAAVVVGAAAMDRPLYWMILAVIALIAGLNVAALPFVLPLTSTGYAWMDASFVWSPVPRIVLNASAVFICGLIPLTALGLAVSCAHRLSCRLARWDTVCTGWLLVGAATGTALGSACQGWNVRSEVILFGAALPTLLVALIAGMSYSSPRQQREDQARQQPPPLPSWSDRWPTLLRASTVATGGAAAFGMTVWHTLVSGNAAVSRMLIPVMLASLGIGMMAECRRRRLGGRSIGGFGITCAVAGVLIAAGTVGLPAVGDVGAARVSMASVVGLAALGYAAAYGRQTLLHRVASQSNTGATILARQLAVCALTVWIFVPLAFQYLGHPATLALLALSLLAGGGALVIHEPSYHPRTRRLRLLAIFVSIGVMILVSVLPFYTRPEVVPAYVDVKE